MIHANEQEISPSGEQWPSVSKAPKLSHYNHTPDL
jgi:hypothetical protein